MKLTVITICLNNVDELRRTVQSVTTQTPCDFEYVVVDGGSTDGCRELIASTSGITRWVSEPDTGIYNAMNKGVGLARGEYVLFLNSGDTLAAPDVLAHAVPRLGKADLYTGHYLECHHGKTQLRQSPNRLTARFLLEGTLMHQATFIRAALLREMPYNEKNKIVSDWEFFIRQWLLGHCSYALLDMVVSVFYVGGISTNKKTVIQGEAERQAVMDNLLPRRVQEAILRSNDYAYDKNVEWKIYRALALPPLKRDLKLLRNAFSFLLRDLFNRHQK